MFSKFEQYKSENEIMKVRIRLLKEELPQKLKIGEFEREI